MDNKTFLSQLASTLEITSNETASLVEGLSIAMREYGSMLDTMAIPGFGNFTAVKHDEQVVVDLSTGRRMLLPPQISIEFKPGSMLKKRLNNG